MSATPFTAYSLSLQEAERDFAALLDNINMDIQVKTNWEDLRIGAARAMLDVFQLGAKVGREGEEAKRAIQEDAQSSQSWTRVQDEYLLLVRALADKVEYRKIVVGGETKSVFDDDLFRTKSNAQCALM